MGTSVTRTSLRHLEYPYMAVVAQEYVPSIIEMARAEFSEYSFLFERHIDITDVQREVLEKIIETHVKAAFLSPDELMDKVNTTGRIPSREDGRSWERFLIKFHSDLPAEQIVQQGMNKFYAFAPSAKPKKAGPLVLDITKSSTRAEVYDLTVNDHRNNNTTMVKCGRETAKAAGRDARKLVRFLIDLPLLEEL